MRLGSSPPDGSRGSVHSGRESRRGFSPSPASSLEAVTNFGTADYRGYTLAADYGCALLDAAPKDAILVPSADHDTFAVVYLQDVLGLRPNLTIADRCGYLEPAILKGTPFEAEIGA